MVLDLREPADDAHEQFVLRDEQLLAQQLAPLLPIGVSSQVQPKRDDRELPGPPDAELMVDLLKLLRADDHDAIRRQPRQHLFDQQEHARLQRAVVTVKDVPVISVDHSASAWPAEQTCRSQPAVQQPGEPSDSPRLGRVRVDHLRPQRDEQPIHLPYRDDVQQRNFPAHLRNDDRLDAVCPREGSHVLLTRRHDPRQQDGTITRAGQPMRQPGDVPRDPADVQPRGDAHHRNARL